MRGGDGKEKQLCILSANLSVEFGKLFVEVIEKVRTVGMSVRQYYLLETKIIFFVLSTNFLLLTLSLKCPE